MKDEEQEPNCEDCEWYGSKCHCQYEEVTNDDNDQ